MDIMHKEPLFVIGMEIIFDSKLEEALDDCSLFDASSADGLSLSPETDEESGDEEDSGYTLGNETDEGSAAASKAASEAASYESKERTADDDLMARLASAYLDTDDDESDSDSSSEEESDGEDESALGGGTPMCDRSRNTDVAVMMGDSHSSEGLMNSFRREGSGKGRSRRSKGSRRLNSDRGMTLKDLTMQGARMHKPGAVLMTATNPVA